jgi:hypothetical protein
LGASLELPKSLPTGSPRIEHLPEKAQKRARKRKEALAAMGAIVARAEEITGQEGLEEDLELRQRHLLRRGMAGPGAAQLLE